MMGFSWDVDNTGFPFRSRVFYDGDVNVIFVAEFRSVGFE